MRLLNDVEAVLLDMDGTLVDSDAAVERAWRIWSDEYGFDAPSVTERAHGRPTLATVRLLRPHWSAAQVRRAAARQLELQYDDLADVVAAPGSDRLLTRMAELRLRWCVVTSADDRLARARLAAAGIRPPLVITIDQVRNGKPDPEGFLLAAAMLKARPDRCVVVEDSEPGLLAGRRAGAITASLRGLPASVMLTDLGDLAALLGGSGGAGADAR